MATKRTTSKAKGNGKKLTTAQQQIRAELSALVGRSRFLQRAGLQFGSKRDIYTVAGYPPRGDIDFDYYWGIYRRGDVAGRIVDMPAKTTWRTPPEVIEEEQDEGTPFTTAFTDLAKRLRLWRYFERVDRLAGVGRYAVLVIGTRGTDDRAMRTPLARVTRPEDIIYLSVFHEGNAEIDTWVTDAGNERFGLPELYKIRLSGEGVRGFHLPPTQIHASRLLHVAEDLLEDEVFGRPRLERAINRLFDLDKVAASTGEAYWQSVVRILQAEIDPEAEIDDPDALRDQMAEMVHDLRRQFIGQGAKLSWLATDTPNPGQVIEMYFSLIAGAAGIPKRILFGSEMGELASSTDQESYLGTINERQEQFAEPQILRAFIDRMIAINALPEPQTGEYHIVWPTLFEESETDKAEANLKRAQAAAALTPVGGDPRHIVEIDDDRNIWLLTQTPEEAEELAEEAEIIDALGPPEEDMEGPPEQPEQPEEDAGAEDAPPADGEEDTVPDAEDQR